MKPLLVACLLGLALAATAPPAQAHSHYKDGIQPPDDEGCMWRNERNEWHCQMHAPVSPFTHAVAEITNIVDDGRSCEATVHQVHVSSKGYGPYTWGIRISLNGTLIEELGKDGDNDPLITQFAHTTEVSFSKGQTLATSAAISNDIVYWDRASDSDSYTCGKEADEALEVVDLPGLPSVGDAVRVWADPGVEAPGGVARIVTRGADGRLQR